MENQTALATQPAPRSMQEIRMSDTMGIVVQTFDDVWRLAQLVAKSGLTTKGIKTPEQVSVQIMMGMEIGIKPIVAIQNIAVINGKAVLPGDLALAVLLNSGQLVDHDERVEGEGDDRIAYCKVERKGMKPIERSFSVKDAIEAGLWETEPQVKKRYWDNATNGYKLSNTLSPNDSPWWKYKARMLVMRARGFAFRDRFSDVLKGMHLAEEMQGHEHDDAQFEVVGGPGAPPEDAENGPTVERHIEKAAPKPRQRAAKPAETKPVETKPVEPAAQPAVPLPDGREIPIDTKAKSQVEDAEIIGSEVTGDPTDDMAEEFDAHAWLLDRKVQFHEAKTEADVDRLHEMFGDTAEADLDAGQRIEYEEAHQKAMARFPAKTAPQTSAAAPAAAGPGVPPGEDDDAFPGDAALQEMGVDTRNSDLGNAFVAKSRAALSDPSRTKAGLIAFWTGNLQEMQDLVADGELHADAGAELYADVNAEAKRLPKVDAPAPIGPEASGDGSAEFNTWFLGKVAEAATAKELNDFSTETLPKRNGYGKDHPMFDSWKSAVIERRKVLQLG